MRKWSSNRQGRYLGSQDRLHGTAPMHLQEQIPWEKKLYDAFLLSLQDPKLTFWLPVFTKVSYGSCNRRKSCYTDGAPFAK